MKGETEEQALAAFEEYLNKAGVMRDGVWMTRRAGISIPRIHFARQVWMNARGFWL